MAGARAEKVSGSRSSGLCGQCSLQCADGFLRSQSGGCIVNRPNAWQRKPDLVVRRLQQLMAEFAHVTPPDIMVIIHEFKLPFERQLDTPDEKHYKDGSGAYRDIHITRKWYQPRS